MAENKNLNNQKFIEGVPDPSTASGTTGKNYEISTNVARDVEEVNRTRMYVIRDDGSNITRLIFPHDMQIGLPVTHESDLRLIGDLTIEGNLEVRGETTGISSGEGGGGGSTKVVYRSFINCTTTSRICCWPGSNQVPLQKSAAGNPRTWLVAPFDGQMTAVQIGIKATNGLFGSVEKIVIDIFKNKTSPLSTHDISTDIKAGGHSDPADFTQKVASIDGAGANYYYKSQAITLDVQTGDVIHVAAARVGGAGDVDATISIVLTESSSGEGEGGGEGGGPGPGP